MTDGHASDVTLRRAAAEDADFMRGLARTAYAHYVQRVGREPGPMLEDYDALVDQAECWIASIPAAPSDGTATRRDVGYLVLRYQPDHLLLDNVAVQPDVQRRGLGSRLLDFADERARAAGLDEVRLYTHLSMTENIALYMRRGYAETHRTEQHGFLRVFMSKRLR